MTRNRSKRVRTKAKRAWLLGGTAAVALLAAGAVGVFGFWLPSQTPVPETVTRTATASLETVQKAVSGTGIVVPGTNEDIDFSVAGTVTSIAVELGDVVEAGDVLASVDSLQLNAAVLSAKATLAEAEAQLVTAQDDNDASDAGEAREAAAEAAVEVSQSAVADAEESVGEATLVAPASGQIVSMGIAVGDKVGASSTASDASAGSSRQVDGQSQVNTASTTASAAAFTLVSTDSWSVSVTVGERDIDNVVAGQQVELVTDDDAKYFGLVTQVGLVPSTTSGSAGYAVDVSVTGVGEGLHDGVSVDVSIVYERRLEVLTVASAAVTTSGGKSVVQLLGDDGSAVETEVVVGETSNSLTEIVTGLTEGDQVRVASFTPGVDAQGDGSSQVSGDGEFPGGRQGASDSGQNQGSANFSPPPERNR